MKLKDSYIKLPAFTLPEVVVSLLLIAILFSTGTTVYMIIYKQGNTLLHKNSFYADYFVLKHVLYNDFSKPGTVTFSASKTQLEIQDFHKKEKIAWLFDSSGVLRTIGNKTDTLQPGGIITASNMLSDTTPLVCALRICCRYKGKSYFIYLRRRYSAEEIFSINDTILKRNE